MSQPHSRSSGQSQASTSTPQPPSATSSHCTPVPPARAGPSGGVSANDDRSADIQAIALDMTQTIANVMSNIADTFPIPGLKIGLLALVEVIKKIQIMQTNVEGVVALQERLRSLANSIDEFSRRSLHRQLPPEMTVRIEELVKLWEGIAKRARKIKNRGKAMRFIRSNRDAKKLGDLVEEINESIQEKVVMQGVLNIESYVYEIHSDVKAIKAFLNVTFIPRYAKMAPYYANEVRRSCLEGTRVDFLQGIYTRITVVCERGESAPHGGIVLWINGMGGTGKTTVARTVAEWCDKKKILAGSFFCSRSDADCSDPTLVFPTLCRHLCAHHEPFKIEVEVVLQRDPDVASYGLYRQFEELIVQPLEALDSPFPRSVFVLDALDELKNKGPQSSKSAILSVISKFVPRIAKFLLLVITSRPEPEITALFEAKREDSLKETTTPLLMHDIPLETAIEDIKRYIKSEFEARIGFLGIEQGWPSTEEKDVLAQQSQGLFIYVATAIKFIMDETHLDPKERIRSLITTTPTSSTPHAFLFSLYTTILVASYQRASPELASRLRNVLGTIVLAQEPLSPLSIARLVGLDATTVRSTLTGLHSVLRIPIENNEPIRIIHPTFPEFLLLRPQVSSEGLAETTPSVHLHLQPAERHWFLFSRCLEVMSTTLHRDMIGIRYPAMFQTEVEDLKQRVIAAIEPHVSYASRFWGHHLRDGIGAAATHNVSGSVRDFVLKTLLYWIETCCLLDAMDKVIFALDTAREVLQTLGGQFADLVPILADCRRFVLTYSPCIHTAPLQLYHSALSIAPTASHVRTKYSAECRHALVVEYGAPTNWAPCLDAVAAHDGAVDGVAFSPDGSCFVTGGWDCKATIRKTATRTPVLSFDGHRGWVLCATFSPDGLRVASGSDDHRVRVWQASSGECVHTLNGHTGIITSVTYSGDGRRILSGTGRGEAKLWDTVDGRCLLTLDKTGNDTYQVGISSDGNVIARGDGATLCMYQVSSATNETLDFPTQVRACTFSPDGCYIAARSEHAIRVWAWPNKSLVRSIDVTDHLRGRLAFSHNSTLVCCGSQDGSVRLWKVASNDPPCFLHGHTRRVNDIACSPDGFQIVSAARDGMIRVWDGTISLSSNSAAENLGLPPPLSTRGPPHFALVKSGRHAIALVHLPSLGIDAKDFALRARMPSGAPTATLLSNGLGAWDSALEDVDDWIGHDSARAWASLTGNSHTPLSQRPFAVSLDGSLMAYPSPASNKAVDICNLHTGRVVVTLTGHTKDVCSITFSPDNARLVTGSEDKSVRVWDTLTGALICCHTEHRDWTRAVAFSRDGCLVASGSDDKTVNIFELSTERIIRVLDSHRDWVMHVTFATDNVHLVALDRAGWVYVWDVTTGTRVHEFSVHDHDHLRSPIFSPDDTGLLVIDNAGAPLTVSLWKPGTRTWPAYHVTRDGCGWVYAMSPGKTRRLGWLPPEWRALLLWDGTVLFICETKSAPDARRRSIALNVAQVQDYIDSLDGAP